MKSLALRVRRRLGRFARRLWMRRAATGRFRLPVVAGHLDESALPVVMCLWNRPDRISAILGELSAQQAGRPIRLLLWNNARQNTEHYREVIRATGAGGSLASVELIDSRFNLGGIARFYIVAHLRRSGYAGPVVLLDDDMDVTPSFTSDLLAHYADATVRGVWAFRQHGSYWQREEVSDGAPADYVGTGGCVLDAGIVDDPRFFAAVPERFLFLEDMWMNYVAVQGGWGLFKADTPVVFVQQEKNQHHDLLLQKEEFYTYLRSDEARERWASAA